MNNFANGQNTSMNPTSLVIFSIKTTWSLSYVSPPHTKLGFGTYSVALLWYRGKASTYKQSLALEHIPLHYSDMEVRHQPQSRLLLSFTNTFAKTLLEKTPNFSKLALHLWFYLWKTHLQLPKDALQRFISFV